MGSVTDFQSLRRPRLAPEPPRDIRDAGVGAAVASLRARRARVAQAARALCVTKGTLYSKMKQYGIGRRATSRSSPGLDRSTHPRAPKECGPS
jgi:hypothetical protein